MTNAELIEALRWCGSEDERHEMCVDESYSCPMWNEDRMTDYCKAELMTQAADALEAAEKQIAEQQKQIARLYLLLNNKINEIAKLETQLPGVSEWKNQYGDGNWHCSKCGAIVEKDEQERHYWQWCYHCGSKMRKG